MNQKARNEKTERPSDMEITDCVGFDFGLNRRCFVKMFGAGLVVVAGLPNLFAQRGPDGRRNLAARFANRLDGFITVFTGKVEGGQGARAELSQAAAEELRVPVERIRLVMGATSLVPDDGITAGSRSTPSTVPVVRRAAAALRESLIDFAARQWNADRASVEVREGKAMRAGHLETLDYTALDFGMATAENAPLTPLRDWKVFGKSVPRPNARDLVTGAHRFPSDIRLPGMLHGKVLRPPAYGAKLLSIDLAPANALPGVVAVREGDFVGVAAPTTFQARQALEAVASTAKWELTPQPSNAEIFGLLESKAQGGLPANPFADDLAQAKQVLRQTYHFAYVQHAPLEPRAAVAVWWDGPLRVWLGTQNPFGCRSELARAFHLSESAVSVEVPDFGGGFGGKHTAEAAIEAARLARATRKPVSVCWTRAEEFTWAYFRPAAVIQVEAGLDAAGTISSWHYVNINSGQAALETPYRIARHRSRFVASESPVRQGSYRALAATANNFARESAMDELASLANADPLAFRLAHLENPRLRAVLETAAKRFGWADRVKQRKPNVGVGLACGTEKGSYVAACVEIEILGEKKSIKVSQVCEVFECGPVLNPENLLAQVQGQIIMGLGPALREEMIFAEGKPRNATFHQYRVPRFVDVPELDIHFLSRPDLEPVGGGETPIIAVAPAIANAVFHATGNRVRSMPIRPA
jgi:isoquinoline 1-oxidoreductase